MNFVDRMEHEYQRRIDELARENSELRAKVREMQCQAFSEAQAGSASLLKAILDGAFDRERPVCGKDDSDG